MRSLDMTGGSDPADIASLWFTDPNLFAALGSGLGAMIAAPALLRMKEALARAQSGRELPVRALADSSGLHMPRAMPNATATPALAPHAMPTPTFPFNWPSFGLQRTSRPTPHLQVPHLWLRPTPSPTSGNPDNMPIIKATPPPLGYPLTAFYPFPYQVYY